MKRGRLYIYPRVSDFSLICKCGAITTYGSMFKEEWSIDTVFPCRICGAKYSANIKITVNQVKTIRKQSKKRCDCGCIMDLKFDEVTWTCTGCGHEEKK